MPLDSLLIILLVANLALTIYLFVRPSHNKWQARKLAVVWILSALSILALFIPADLLLLEQLGAPFFATLGSIVMLGGYGEYIRGDITQYKPNLRVAQGWWAVIVLWAVLFTIGSLTDPNTFVGWRWMVELPISGVVLFVGIMASGSFLFVLCCYYFYYSNLPELGNRNAYWLIVSTAIMTGVILLASGSSVFQLSGAVAIFIGLLATTYAHYHHRLLDIRTQLLGSLNSVAAFVIAWSLIFSIILFVTSERVNNIEDLSIRFFVFMVLAFGSAILLIPAISLIDFIIGLFLQKSTTNLGFATAEYSRNVALAPDLPAVIKATNDTLCNTIKLRKSALILINNTYKRKDSVELVVLETGATMRQPTIKGFLSKKSPIYQTLAVEKVPLGQFDIEYGEAYRGVIAEERAFFGQMGMHAFVPIVAEGNLIGLLACGGKLNDMAFTRDDMELLSIIGQQVGNALRNARLIDDLQHLNNSMRDLNKRLEDAKIELEKMDNIKTDFVTIASHELRTPLAQIRGYTDIIDSLNESGALQKGQTSQMVQNLRKSTERMEELISAMLDVSQLDVNSMDLRFVRTTPETVVRMAMEPLKEAIEQRKQTLTREGLSGLPHIQADMQRLVQAFRNVMVNAIKYTPDGGKIEITASLEKQSDGKDKILFAIRDTGIGVAPKDIELIFQKFYRGFDTQLHSTGMTKFLGAGPGLGLTITKGIIEGHGGEIWVESPGQDMNKFPGATFYIRLPILPPEGQRLSLPFDEQVNEQRRKTLSMPVVKANEAMGLTKPLSEETSTTIPPKSNSEKS
jgi:signal transduction histidine kinase